MTGWRAQITHDATHVAAGYLVDAVQGLAGHTVLVAGAGGVIARHAVFLLERLAYTARVPLRIVCLARDVGKAQLVFGGLSNVTVKEQTLGAPLEYKGASDWIIHCGGSNPPGYGSDQLGIIAANVTAATHLIELAGRQQTRRIAYFSIREVYGHTRPDNGVLHEPDLGLFDHLDVHNAYPEANRATEKLLAAAAAQVGIRWQSHRLASVYGAGMKLDDSRAMSDLLAARLAGKGRLQLAGDGTTVRSYCYAADAASAVLTALFLGDDDTVYNIANETEPVTIRDLAETIADAHVPGTHRPQVQFGTEAEPAGYSPFGYLPVDISRIARLGWTPRIGLADGIQRTLDSFRTDQHL